jgi:nickel-type superoxide dismutase maturation protease
VHWPIGRVKVAERSMEPALHPGDWLFVRRTRRIRPGQIVLARHPGRPELLLVKRAARRVDGGWWLESDNPGAGAVDSRRFGAVPGDLIEGRVLGRYRRARSLSRTARVSRPGVDTERPRLATGLFLVGRELSGGVRAEVLPRRPAC